MDLLSELRFVLRTLRKSPAFTLTAVSALAIGIGANTAIFSLVNQVLLNPPGIANPERIVALRCKYDKLALKSIPLSATDFADVRKSANMFDDAAMGDMGDFNYRSQEGPIRLPGASVTADWFNVFGARPRLGRTFRPEDDQPGANTVVVLSDAAWKRYFGGNPQIVGQAIELNQKQYRIAGVMGPEFRAPSEAEIWVPLGLPADAYGESNRFNESYVAVARMKAGVSLDQANAFIQVLNDRVRNSGTRGAEYAKDSQWAMFAVPMTDFVAGDTKRPMLVLVAAVGFVLLIACSNIAGLLLARASARGREVAVRVALGASRVRLLQQTMSESIVLAFSGAAAGIAVAFAGMALMLRIAPEEAISTLSVRIDAPVLLFTLTVTILSAILFGLAPAWQISQIHPYETLKLSARGISGKQRLRGALVVGESALALVLLAGAGLFLRSLAHLQVVSPGFEPRGVLTATLTLPPAQYEENTKRIAFYRAVIDRIASTPGVTSASAAVPAPFTGSTGSASFNIEGRPTRPGDPGPHGDIRYVSPGYFETMRIPLKSGRNFNLQDRQGSDAVAIVDENLARQYWPNENPVGRHIRNGSSSPWATIVGVVGHVSHTDLASDPGKGTYYYSMYQQSAPMATLLLKTEGNAASYASALRDAVSAADPNQPVHHVKTMSDLVSASLASRRFILSLLVFFAGTALFMAALGLYGIMSYSVTQRTREIGIRMALGADRASVLHLVVGQGVRLAGAGCIIGVVSAVLCGQLIRTQLYGISPTDPITLGVTGVVLLTAAALASYLPARRATRVDPLEALRYE